MDLNNTNQQKEISILIVLGLKLKEVSREKYQMEDFLIDRLELSNRQFQSILFEESSQMESNLSKSFILLSGRGENGNESKMMKDYLKRTFKYSDDQIVVDENSMTIVENFIFSFFQIWKLCEKVHKNQKFNLHIITSDYHIERSKYICETFLPFIKKAFINNQIGLVKYHESITNTREGDYLMNLSQEQIDEFLDPNFNWSQFGEFRYLKQEDNKLFLEYSQLYKN